MWVEVKLRSGLGLDSKLDDVAQAGLRSGLDSQHDDTAQVRL